MVPRMSRIALVTLIVFNVVPMITILGGTAAAGTIQYGGNLGSTGGGCLPGNATVFANEDTWVQEGDESNKGGDSDLLVRRLGGNRARALVGFSLPTIPAECDVTDASFRLRYSNGDSSGVHSVVRAASDWTEATTWSNQPAQTGTPVSQNVDTGWTQWDVDQLVTDMYASGNYGFVVRHANEAGSDSTTHYHSRETANDPQLYVEWDNAAVTTTSLTTTSSVPKGNSIIVSFGIDGDAVGGIERVGQCRQRLFTRRGCNERIRRAKRPSLGARRERPSGGRNDYGHASCERH